MKRAVLIVLAALAAGCSSPPKPPSCEGEFKPVNKPSAVGAAPSSQRFACIEGVNHAA